MCGFERHPVSVHLPGRDLGCADDFLSRDTASRRASGVSSATAYRTPIRSMSSVGCWSGFASRTRSDTNR